MQEHVGGFWDEEEQRRRRELMEAGGGFHEGDALLVTNLAQLVGMLPGGRARPEVLTPQEREAVDELLRGWPPGARLGDGVREWVRELVRR